MSKGNRFTGIRVLDTPYFENWTLWLNIMDKSNGNTRRYIVDSVVDYITSKGITPTGNRAKPYWVALSTAAKSEGITIAALIEKACAIKMDMFNTLNTNTLQITNNDTGSANQLPTETQKDKGMTIDIFSRRKNKNTL